jgi:hypothetical protein
MNSRTARVSFFKNLLTNCKLVGMQSNPAFSFARNNLKTDVEVTNDGKCDLFSLSMLKVHFFCSENKFLNKSELVKNF